MDIALKALKEMDDYRHTVTVKNTQPDYAIRVCQAILAKAAGFPDRAAWKQTIESK